MAFKPQSNHKPEVEPHYIRIDAVDWARIQEIAKIIPLTPAEVVRQAIRYALKDMEN